MNTSEFDRLTRNSLYDCLHDELGFEFSEGVFFREIPSKILQLITMDLDVKKGGTFRVIIGFNSRVISGDLPPAEAGSFGVRYLSAGGISTEPVNFPCFSKLQAEKSLLKTLGLIKYHVIPWFSVHESLDALLGVIEEQYPFIKGKVLFHAGRLDEAKKYLVDHLAFLARQKRTQGVEHGVRETQEMLKQCP